MEPYLKYVIVSSLILHAGLSVDDKARLRRNGHFSFLSGIFCLIGLMVLGYALYKFIWWKIIIGVWMCHSAVRFLHSFLLRFGGGDSVFYTDKSGNPGEFKYAHIIHEWIFVLIGLIILLL